MKNRPQWLEHFSWRAEQRDALAGLPTDLAEQLSLLPRDKRFDALCQAYTQLYAQQRRQQALQILENILRDNSHTDVIENRSDKLSSILTGDNVGFRWPWFCLILVRIEDYSAYLMKDCGGCLAFDDFRNMYESISGAFEQAARQKDAAHCVEHGRDCVCFINLKDLPREADQAARETAVARITALARSCAAQLEKNMGISLEVAVSEVYCDVTDTAKHLSWLQLMLEYARFVQIHTAVISPEEVQRMAPPLSSQDGQPGNQEKLYFAAVLSRSLPEAETRLNAMVDSLAGTTQDTTQLKAKLRARLMPLLSICDVPLEENPALLEAVDAVAQADTLRELKDQIHQVFVQLSAFEQAQSASQAGRILEIQSWLEGNCLSADFSVARMSDALGISQSYISRIYKKETGTGILDSVHARRIAEAKRLLAGTGLSVTEISLQVGYASAWTLNRAFKRYEGMTPGSYRQLVQQKETE